MKAKALCMTGPGSAEMREVDVADPGRRTRRGGAGRGKGSQRQGHRGRRLRDHLVQDGGLKVLNTAPGMSRFSLDEFRRAVELMRRGVFDQRPLITHAFDFSEAPAELASLADRRPPDYMKGVFVFPRERA